MTDPDKKAINERLAVWMGVEEEKYRLNKGPIQRVYKKPDGSYTHKPPAYTDDIGAAMGLLEKIPDELLIEINRLPGYERGAWGGSWEVVISDGDGEDDGEKWCGYDNNLALAVARAVGAWVKEKENHAE